MQEDTARYQGLYEQTCISHREQTPSERVCNIIATRLIEKDATQLMAEANAGDVQSTLDMAIRACTGCGAPEDLLAAADLLVRVLMREPPPPRGELARAYALATYVFLHLTDTADVRGLQRAACFADEAAALGFVPPVVLEVAHRVAAMDLRRADIVQPQGWHADNVFATLTALWQAYDNRVSEQNGDSRAPDVKQDNPNFYLCAAEGCGLQAAGRGPLRVCGGTCPEDGKPAYCSEECQKSDWPRHKPFCKPFPIVPDDVVLAIRATLRRPALSLPADDVIAMEAAREELEQAAKRALEARMAARVMHASDPMDPEVLRQTQTEFARAMVGFV